MSYHLNAASLKEPMHNYSASYDTSTITTQTTVPQQPINVTPNLWPGHVENSQIDITSREGSSTGVISKTKGLHTTPSVNYISVYTSIYTASLDKMNMAESTTQTSEVIRNGHHGDSKIGMHTHVTYQNNHNTLFDNSDNNTHNNLQTEAA